MVGLVLVFVGLGLLLWLLAASATDRETELDPKFEVAPASGDPDSPSIGMDLFGFDDLAGLEADDPWGQNSDGLLPALPEDPLGERGWADLEDSAFGQTAVPDSLADNEACINPATGLAMPDGPGGIDTGGNVYGCGSTDDTLHYGTDMSLGDSGWSDASVGSFGSDDW